MVLPGKTWGTPLRTVLVERGAGAVAQDPRGYWNRADFSQLKEEGVHGVGWDGSGVNPLRALPI